MQVYTFQISGSHSYITVVLCLVRSLSFECLNPERSFYVCGYMFGIPSSRSYIKVIRSRSRSQKQRSMSVCSVRGWPAFD